MEKKKNTGVVIEVNMMKGVGVVLVDPGSFNIPHSLDVCDMTMSQKQLCWMEQT